MGTDLHVMVEVSHFDEPWHPIQNNSELSYDVPRDYALFSLLASVRNRSGLGATTPMTTKLPDGSEISFPYDTDDGQHDPIKPIAMPKGVPDDASDAWLLFVGHWMLRRNEVHTTYLTPEEILDADWDQVIYKDGLVLEEDYLVYKEQGTLPERVLGGAGGDILIVNEIEYESGVRGEHGSTIIKMRWRAGTLRELCSDFLEMTTELESHRPETSRMRFMMLFES